MDFPLKGFERFLKVSRLWRSHTHRTPEGDEFIGSSELSQDGLLCGQLDYCHFNVFFHAVFQVRLGAALFVKSQFPALFIEFFKAVETVS